MDHAAPWPFVRLADAWLHSIGQPYDVELRTDVLVQSLEHDTDLFAPSARELAQAFAEFHRQHAILRVVHPFANMVILPALARDEDVEE